MSIRDEPAMDRAAEKAIEKARAEKDALLRSWLVLLALQDAEDYLVGVLRENRQPEFGERNVIETEILKMMDRIIERGAS